ncbi:hypothetical protein ABZP36_013160 [Zizania latifolia]
MPPALSFAARQLEEEVMARLRSCAAFRDVLRVHAHVVRLCLCQSSYLATQIVHLCSRPRSAGVLPGARPQPPPPQRHDQGVRPAQPAPRRRDTVGVYVRRLRCTPFPPDGHAGGNRFTYPFLLKECGGMAALELGKQMHAQAHTRAGDLALAHKVFDGMRERDVESGNTLISAHARRSQMRKARALFNSMPDKTVVSCTAMVSGYTAVGDFSGAVEIIANSIDQALQLFDGMADKDVISGSTVISDPAAHGRAHEAVRLFTEMEEEGTFVGFLSACSHAGLVD